jgi:hypothetical protein
VEGYSIRRKMINAANQIASVAYNERTNVDDVMDEAEKAVFNVSERRLKHDLEPISSVLSEYYDRIDDLAKRRWVFRINFPMVMRAPAALRPLISIVPGQKIFIFSSRKNSLTLLVRFTTSRRTSRW